MVDVRGGQKPISDRQTSERRIRPSSPTSSSVYVFVPTWRRNSALGARGWSRVARVAANTRTYRPPVLGNSVLLRNADRKRTRRCVPSAVLIWPADRNHAKIIAQRHPSCASSWSATARRRRPDTRGTRGKKQPVFRSGQMLRRRCGRMQKRRHKL